MPRSSQGPRVAAFVLAMAIGGAGSAQAQVEPQWPQGEGEAGSQWQQAPAPPTHLWGDLAFHSGGGDAADVIALSPQIGGSHRITEHLEIEGIIPLAWASVTFEAPFGDGDESRTGFKLGNPYLGAAYVNESEGVRFRVGGGLTIPLAQFPDSVDPSELGDVFADLLALVYANAMNGAWNIWLWVPEAIAIVVPAHVETTVDEKVVLGADLGFGVLVPTEKDAADIEDDDDDTELVMQIGVDFGVPFGDGSQAGIRFRAFEGLTLDGDGDQLALEPYARIGSENGYFLGRFTMNLDKPYGFAFDEGKVWGLHLGGGGRF